MLSREEVELIHLLVKHEDGSVLKNSHICIYRDTNNEGQSNSCKYNTQIGNLASDTRTHFSGLARSSFESNDLISSL